MIKLNSFVQNIARIEKQHIGESDNMVAWQVVSYDKNNNPLGGGVAVDIETAKRISLAEYCERLCFLKISKSQSLSSEFEIKNHPTTCGFAAGFEREKVKLRSIAESLERWVWSKWIDENYKLELTENINHTKISNYLASYFERCLIFKKDFKIKIPHDVELQFVVFLGFKNGGVFPGSRVCSINENPYEHAVVEAYRHLKISEMESEKMDFPYNRINFFAKNQQVALSQIGLAKNELWPNFSIKLLKEFQTNVEGLYVFRCIGYSFMPWNEGEVDRFVY